MILLYITIGLFILYSILIIYYWLAWRSVPFFIPPGPMANTRISVIIAARNEEANISRLLEAMQAQTYPKAFFETIVVDDHSTDGTAAIVREFPTVRLMNVKEDNINSYKKKAIETGIGAATGDWIITTDADCLPSPRWLETMAAFKENKQAVFVAAPVVIECNSSVLQLFQAMDFMVLQGITGASVHKKIHAMCNGANLGYERNAFKDVNGFSGIDQIASGDDMLLMHKIWKKYPQRIHYLKSKEAIVSTQPVKSWREFFSQRIRWASKARSYDDKSILPVLLLVYLFNLSFVVLLVACCCSALGKPPATEEFSSWWVFILGLWIAKTLIELPFFYSVAKFFDKSWAVFYFFFFQPLHIFYTIGSGLLGQLGKYRWKGRTVK